MSTVPDSVLSQVTMVGPETTVASNDTGPLWIAELATPYSGKGERPVVAKRPGLSTLFERDAADEVKLKVGTFEWKPVQMRQPVLMRAQVVATNDRPLLKLWSAERKQYNEGSVRPLAGKDDRISVLTPRRERWADQPAIWDGDDLHAWVPEIGVPPLRLVEGRVALGLVVNAQPLPKLLQLVPLSANDGLVLGGLKVGLERAGGQQVLPIELTPQGIEFEAWLPDPTFDFIDPPQDDGTLQVIVRLEDDGSGGRLLRLVGCRNQSTLDNLERRLAFALARLGAGNSPLAVRFDIRPAVPSITWRLKAASVSSLAFDGGLSASTGGPRWNSWNALLNPAGLDLRVVTGQSGGGVVSDVAQVGVLDVTLSRVPGGRVGDATLSLRINSSPAVSLSKYGPEAEVAFTRVGNAWQTTSNFNGGQPASVSIDLDVPLQRLDPLNRAARVIEPEAHTPALFLLMQHGWLQAAVPDEVKPSVATPPAPLAGPLSPVRYGSLTGRLVAGPATGCSIAIESAVHSAVVVEWKIDFDAPGIPEASHVQVRTWGTEGRLSGYLFCSEAAPSEEEMLPTLRGGSATLRDLHFDFGAPRRWGRWWSGSMAIEQADANSQWRLELELPLEQGWIAWLHDARLPLISNASLTRAARSSGQPSVSRCLLPVELVAKGTKPGKLVLQTDGQSSLPLVGCDGETRWLNHLFEKDDQILLMPTLLGIELRPSDAAPLAPLAGNELPKPLSLGLQARLRMDLPQLDELMASVEIPRKPAAAPPPATVKTTALLPDRLASAWLKIRDRMALTVTEDIYATGWAATRIDRPGPPDAPDAPDAPPATVISYLVEPFTWRTSFGVSTSRRYAAPDGLPASLPLGSYWLAGRGYSLEQTALGMGTADQPAHFGISANSKEIVAGDDHSPIHVSGFAAALYRVQNADFDSRGFGMLPKAELRSGLSIRRALTREAGKAPASHVLVTLMQTLRIESNVPSNPKLGLFVRDLPMKDEGGALTFEGKDNGSESFLGTEGLAFEPEHLPFSLHEWRLFERNAPESATGLYSLGWGPLAFTPLRLWRLKLNLAQGGAAPKLGVLEVIGKLSLADGPDSWNPGARDTPYGPDEVYRPGDLFKLAVDDHSTFTLSAIKLTPDPNRLAFNTQQDGMVEIRTNATLTGHADVPISLNFVPRQDGSAELRARLFGFERALKGTVQEFSPDRIKVQLKASPTPTACLRVESITVTLLKNGGRWKAKLEIEVAIALLNEESEPLFERVKNGTWRWLNLRLREEPVDALKIDHATGRVEWLADQVFQPEAQKAQIEPLAGLAAAGFAVRGVVAIAAPQQTPDAWPNFELGTTALHFEMEGREAPIPHAPEFLTGLSIRHAYGGGKANDQKRHTLRVDWMATCDSVVGWPVGSVSFTRATNGGNLTWVRLMNIAANAQPQRHAVKLALRGHEIPSEVLGPLPDPGGSVRYGFVKPWRFIATTVHRIGDAPNAIEWTSLDRVAMMPARALVSPDDDPFVYAARYRKGSYRGQTAMASEVAHAGVAKRSLAEAGFADKHLQAAFIAEGIRDAWDPVVVGGSVTLFADAAAGDVANLAVVPWLGALGRSDSKLPRLDQCDLRADLQWRISLADALATHPVVTQRTSALVMLPATAGSARIEHDLRESLALGNSTATLSHLPVEQAYFELFDDSTGKAKSMDGQTASTVPYFPLALAVLQEVWNRRAKPVSAICLFATTGLQSRAVRVQIQPEEAVLPVEGSGVVPIDLYAVSRDAVRAMPEVATTALLPDLAPEAVTNRQQLARLRDLAMRGAGEPVAIIVRTQRTADPAAGHLFSSIDPLPAIDDFGTAAGTGDAKPCVQPSPAFGWPSMSQTGNLGKLALAVGQESPVLSEASGFAGRGLALGLPAWAAPKWDAAGTGPEAMYLTFADQVVFQRPEAVRFRGPAARHLVPVPTRLRAPLYPQQTDALKALAPDTRVDECAPILPPRLERTTIGDRPGVFHAMTASVVLPAEQEGFDADQPGFARPASSGPVVVHQLRAPRSPALPDDQDLAYRRRTFVSEADRLPPAEPKRYVSFCALDRPAEIFREEQYGGWRFTLVHVPLGRPDALISPQWNGELAIGLESRTVPDQTAFSEAQALMKVGLLPTSDPATLSASLRIGAVEFAFDNYEFSNPVTVGMVTTRQVTFSMAPVQLAGALLRMADSPADTPISVELHVTPQETNGPEKLTGKLWQREIGILAFGPPRHLTLLLLRDHGTRPTPPVLTTTVAFGDPAYDRQLGSKTLASAPDYQGQAEFVLILDRDKYDLGSTIHLAGGLVDSNQREFNPCHGELKLAIFRIPRSDAGPNASEDKFPLYAAEKRTGEEGVHMIEDGKAYAIHLPSVRDANGNAARLEAGDRLRFELSAPTALNGTTPKNRVVVVQLTEEPTIAPPPSVYSLLAMRTDGNANETSARIALHACAPLPTRIEFPDLLKDLAQGYVRRRGLFIWSWAQVETSGMKLALLKLDRSGGCQLPRSMQDFIQV